MDSKAKFYSIKDEVRILGIDDSPFEPKSSGRVLIVGAIMRGGSCLDGVLSSDVEVDGLDATRRVVEMAGNTSHRDLRVVMLDGLGFAGFNLVDIQEVYMETGLPVIVVVRQKPDFDKIKSALQNLPDFSFRWGCIEKAGEPHQVESRDGKSIYIQVHGISLEDAREIVKLSATRSLIPEPIRVAHLIASGIILGESRGRA